MSADRFELMVQLLLGDPPTALAAPAGVVYLRANLARPNADDNLDESDRPAASSDKEA